MTNQWGKKNIIRELYYREEEKHGEKRDERQIERERKRSMTRGETKVSDSESVRTKERKSESLLWELLTNQWGEKIYIIRELYFRGEEKHGEKRDERQIEREREREKDLWQEGRPELVTMKD